MKLILSFLSFALPCLIFSNPSRPNIILIMADDMGYGDPSYNNESVLTENGNDHPDQGWMQTPVMDSMAANGLVFTRFYSASSVCSPTRASCLTGRNPLRTGVPWANRGTLKRDETPISVVLSEEGYTTGHFGKWHLGTMTTLRDDANRGQPGNTSDYGAPWHFAYDVCFATESKVPTYHPYRASQNNSTPLPVEFIDNDPELGYFITDNNFYGTHYWTMPGDLDADEGMVVPLDIVNNLVDGDDSKLVTDQAITFIQDAVAQDNPFFAVIWYHTPHRPMVDPELITGEDSTDALKDSIEDMDAAIGTLRTALENLGVRDNTMIWLTSDNGPENNDDSPNEIDTDRSIRSGGLRDRKRSFYEGGLRVPSILEWPAVVTEARVTDFVSSTSDYYPTILDYLDLSADTQKPIDGISLRPAIEGTSNDRISPIGFLGNGGRSAWIEQDFKLVRQNNGDWQLFDMTLPDHQLEISPLATEANIGGQSQSIQNQYNDMLSAFEDWNDTVDSDTAYVNTASPTNTISGPTAVNAPFLINVQFDRAVQGLSPSDLAIEGATAVSVSGSGTDYTVVIAPDYADQISISLPHGAAFATDGTPNIESNTLQISVTPPSVSLNPQNSEILFAGGPHTTVDANNVSPATLGNNLNSDKFGGNPFATTLYVRGHSNDSQKVRAFMTFDLSTLPGGDVANATLFLRGFSLNDNNSNTLQVSALGQSWTTTPSYQIARQGGIVTGADVSTGLNGDLIRDYQLDVSEMVRSWVSGTWVNHGLVLELANESASNGIGFYTTGANGPRLEIEQVGEGDFKIISSGIVNLSEQTPPFFHIIGQSPYEGAHRLNQSSNTDGFDWSKTTSSDPTNSILSFSVNLEDPTTTTFFHISKEFE